MFEYIPRLVEIPFKLRHKCWFCGEPNACYFNFPTNKKYYSKQEHVVLDCSHPLISLPSCNECYRVATKAVNKHKLNSIWLIKDLVKSYLLNHYRKDLAIGINWTKEELENSEFEGGNFEGFQKSAWFMYEVAKARLNYSGWVLVIDGVELINDDYQKAFDFDGVFYPSIEHASQHYCKTFALDEHYFRQVLHHLGRSNFANTVRFCRLLVDATPHERKAALLTLT